MGAACGRPLACRACFVGWCLRIVTMDKAAVAAVTHVMIAACRAQPAKSGFQDARARRAVARPCFSPVASNIAAMRQPSCPRSPPYPCNSLKAQTAALESLAQAHYESTASAQNRATESIQAATELHAQATGEVRAAPLHARSTAGLRGSKQSLRPAKVPYLSAAGRRAGQAPRGQPPGGHQVDARERSGDRKQGARAAGTAAPSRAADGWAADGGRRARLDGGACTCRVCLWAHAGRRRAAGMRAFPIPSLQ